MLAVQGVTWLWLGCGSGSASPLLESEHEALFDGGADVAVYAADTGQSVTEPFGLGCVGHAVFDTPCGAVDFQFDATTDGRPVGQLLTDLRPRQAGRWPRWSPGWWPGPTRSRTWRCGAIAGARGWLLSGSANLSRAALIGTVGGHGNVEVAVLAPLAADEARPRPWSPAA